jgi:hypothetical protein
MDPEEYQQTMRAVWEGVARLSGVLILIVVSPVVLWLVVRFWYYLVDLFDLRVDQLIGSALPVSGFVAFLVRRNWIRWRVALAGAAGTLAIGVVAGVMQLDGQRWLRTGRFWCHSPKELDEQLDIWATHRHDPDRIAVDRPEPGTRRSRSRKPGRKPKRKKKK